MLAIIVEYLVSQWRLSVDTTLGGSQWSLGALRSTCRAAFDECNKYILDRAASYGSLSGMVKLAGLGYLPTPFTCFFAALHSHLTCLIFAHGILKAPLGPALSVAVKFKHHTLIEYAQQACWTALIARSETDKVLQWTKQAQEEYMEPFQ